MFTQPPVPGLGQFPAVMSLSVLDGANGFRLDGVSLGEYSGLSLSAAGDVNQDGIVDIIIGAFGANVGAGKTYVVFGKAGTWDSIISLNVLNGTNGFRLEGVSAEEYSGISVSAAGDINNDGITDIVIGADNANSFVGKTYVVFGKASGWTSSISLSTLNGTNGFRLDGASPNGFSGASVSVGDVNNDGIADIVIGAHNANSRAGKIYVVFGKRSGWSSPISLSTLNGTNGFTLDGVSADDVSGASVSAAGDVNGDDIGDIIIGAPSANSSAGRTYVVFGKAGIWPNTTSLSTLNGTNGFSLDGVSANDESGTSVSTAGDVNNDGLSDILIGAYNANSAAGKIYVVFGKASGWSSSISLGTLNGTNGFALEGVSANDRSGWPVSAAGDVNQDGIADIIIGAPWAKVGTRTFAGKTYVVFGKASGWASSISLSTLNGTNGFLLAGISAVDYSGRSVSAGDVNNDGIADIIIGASGANSGAGKTYVVFGDSPSVLANNSLTIGAGCTVTLNSAYLGAYDLNHANSTLMFAASNVTNGYFEKTVGGVVTALTTPVFSQSDITAGYVQFVSTSSNAPSYNMMVTSSGLAFVPATPAVVSFTPYCSEASTQVPTAEPSFAPTAVPSLSDFVVLSHAPTAEPTLLPSFAEIYQISAATRTSPIWLLPISQAASFLDASLPTAYQSVSDYLSDSVASGKPLDNIDAASSLQAAGAQLMLGAVALKLVQKGIHWAKNFWAPAAEPKANLKPAVLEEAAQSESVQTFKDFDTVQALESTIENLSANFLQLSQEMEARLDETAEQNTNVVYSDFQKPSINFSYDALIRNTTPAVTKQAILMNSARLVALGR